MSAALLAKLGVYIDPGFLSADHCEALCEAALSGEQVNATVYSEDSKESRVDPALRMSAFANVSPDTLKDVTARLESVRETLESHFAETFSEILELPKLLIYREGHFFGPHTDNQLGRRINMSIYLNDETDEPAHGSYGGGALKIYGLIKTEGWKSRGITLRGRRGMLVAYPADLVHEITPITHGCRIAIISRLLSPMRHG